MNELPNQPMTGIIPMKLIMRLTTMFTIIAMIIFPKSKLCLARSLSLEYMCHNMMTKGINSNPAKGRNVMIAAQKECFLTIFAVSLSNILSPTFANWFCNIPYAI